MPAQTLVARGHEVARDALGLVSLCQIVSSLKSLTCFHSKCTSGSQVGAGVGVDDVILILAGFADTQLGELPQVVGVLSSGAVISKGVPGRVHLRMNQRLTSMPLALAPEAKLKCFVVSRKLPRR